MDGSGTKVQVSCVIYDCDGVLFDSLEANKRLYNFIAESMGRPPLSQQELRYCHTHTVFESLRHMFRDDQSMEIKAREFLKKNVDFKDFIVYLKMEPDLLQVLAELKKRGIMRAISTNRTTSMEHIMERFGLWPYFDMVVTALDVTNPKPHPESVEKILTTLNIDRQEVVFVGDSEVDMETARSSGVCFVAYKNKDITPDNASGTFIDNHLKLLGFLRSERRLQGPSCP